MVAGSKRSIYFSLVLLILVSCKDLYYPVDKRSWWDERREFIATISSVAYQDNRTYVQYLIESDRGLLKSSTNLKGYLRVVEGSKYLYYCPKGESKTFDGVLMLENPHFSLEEEFLKTTGVIQKIESYLFKDTQFYKITYTYKIGEINYRSHQLLSMDENLSKKELENKPFYEVYFDPHNKLRSKIVFD